MLIMRLSDFIARVDKDIYLNIFYYNGDLGCYLIYFGKANDYLFNEKDNSYFVDYFNVSFIGGGKFLLEVRVVC